MSKVSFVILSIVSLSLLHLLLLPFAVNCNNNSTIDFHVNDEATTMSDEVALLTNNSPDSVEVVQLDPHTMLLQHEMGEDMANMGVSDVQCDDGRVNLATDFNPHDPSEVERHTKCLKNDLWMGNATTKARLTIVDRHQHYVSIHKCMTEKIAYFVRIPTIGPHRPLWPIYGEYRYCPPQRWLHNVEHGNCPIIEHKLMLSVGCNLVQMRAIVALYHPCADPQQVEQLRNIVKRCLFRHVITPYLNLTAERPLALVGWAASLEMPLFDFDMSKNFIKLYALSGPEKVFRDGQYGQLLVEKAEYVTNEIDAKVCPNM